LNLGLVKYVDRYFGIVLCHVLSAIHLFREMISPVRGTVVPRRILLIKLWGLGNIVMLLPVIRAIRRRYPNAEIHFLSLRRNGSLLERERDLEEVHYLDDSSALELLSSAARAYSRIRRARIDLLIDFEQFARASALFGFLVGARHRIGLNTPGQGRGHIYTAQVPYDDGQHMTETFLDLARAAGVEEETYVPQAPHLDEADREHVATWLARHDVGEGALVVMHPGSGDNFPGRRWPASSFARLGDALVERFGATVVVTGSRSERPLVEEVRRAARHALLDGCEAFSVRQLGALLERADLLASNDTAPVHLAAALGRPVVGFYGPNTPRLYGPVGSGHAVFYGGLPCSPCITNFNYKTSFCRMPVCITNIRVRDVVEAASRILERSSRREERETASVGSARGGDAS
jgi:heptosyltransferase-3